MLLKLIHSTVVCWDGERCNCNVVSFLSVRNKYVVCWCLDADETRDWTVIHGRSIALSTALKDASSRLLSADNLPRIKKALVAFCSADRVSNSSVLWSCSAKPFNGGLLLLTAESVYPCAQWTWNAFNMTHQCSPYTLKFWQAIAHLHAVSFILWRDSKTHVVMSCNKFHGKNAYPKLSEVFLKLLLSSVSKYSCADKFFGGSWNRQILLDRVISAYFRIKSCVMHVTATSLFTCVEW